MAPALIDQYDLLRGIKKLGTWWEWSELFFSNGFDLSMHRRDCTDALWAATLAAHKGPGQWYADLREPALFVLRQGRSRRLISLIVAPAKAGITGGNSLAVTLPNA